MDNLIKLHPDFASSGYLEGAPTFTSETAQQLFASNEQFPVPLDYAGQWAGYSRRENALRAFKSCGFIENVDYEVVSVTTDGNSEGRPRKEFRLTVRCLKEFFASSHTKQGKQYRKYLISAEEQLQLIKQQQRVLSPELSAALTAMAQSVALSQQMFQGLLQGQAMANNRLDVLSSDLESLKRKDALEVICVSGYLKNKGISAYKLSKDNAYGIEFASEADLRRELGKNASALCREKGITPDKVNDARWGTVNAYPIAILDEVLAEYLVQEN